MRGYHIQAFGSGDRPIGRIGRLIDPPAEMRTPAEQVPFADDQRRTIVIVAKKNEMTTLTDGDGVLDSYQDSDAMFNSGGIAFACWADAIIQIKEISIKEVPDHPRLEEVIPAKDA